MISQSRSYSGFASNGFKIVHYHEVGDMLLAYYQQQYLKQHSVNHYQFGKIFTENIRTKNSKLSIAHCGKNDYNEDSSCIAQKERLYGAGTKREGYQCRR